MRFGGRVVLDHGYTAATDWQPERFYDYRFTGIPRGFARGDAVKVKAGQFYDLEILIGEQPGGRVFFCLLMEEAGAEYARDAFGNPILPIFRLVDLPTPEPQPGEKLPPFAANGPVWKAASAKPVGGASFEQVFGPK